MGEGEVEWCGPFAWRTRAGMTDHEITKEVRALLRDEDPDAASADPAVGSKGGAGSPARRSSPVKASTAATTPSSRRIRTLCARSWLPPCCVTVARLLPACGLRLAVELSHDARRTTPPSHPPPHFSLLD